ALAPPPLPDQTVSDEILLEESRWSVVPPTPTTKGEAAGYSTPAPLSPAEAKKATPGTLKWKSVDDSVENSEPPQLIETCLAPRWTAKSTATRRSLVEADFEATTAMVASGAMACAHSTSSEVSPAQPLLVPGVPWGL